jgi:hypothetical protein
VRRLAGSTALLIWLVASCATPEEGPLINLNVLHDLGSDIGAFRTWSWHPDTPYGTGHPGYDDDFIDACLREAIERELAQRGYVHAGSDQADFLIGYRIDIDRDQEEEADYDPGDLSLLVVDTRDGELAWLVTGHKQMMRVRPRDERKRRIDDGIRRMFLEFRPLGSETPGGP